MATWGDYTEIFGKELEAFLLKFMEKIPNDDKAEAFNAMSWTLILNGQGCLCRSRGYGPNQIKTISKLVKKLIDADSDMCNQPRN